MPSCRMISATQISTTTARAASIGPSAAPRSLRASTPTLRPPMPTGRPWPIRSTSPATRAHCPAAPAGAWRRASRSRRLTSLRRWPRPGTAFGMCWACGTVRPMRRCGPSAPRTTLPPGPATCTAASTAPPTRGRTRPTTARTKRRFLPSCRAGRGSAVFCLRWACSALCCASWQSFCRSGVKNARHRLLCRGCCCSASSALRCCAVP